MKIIKKAWKHNKLIRYAVGGGTAALIDLAFLWFFTDIVHIYYLISQVLAFVFSFIYGFFFQKYFTFRDSSKRYTNQVLMFLIFQLIGLGIGLLILSFSVTYVGLHYLVGSVIAKGVVFVWNYIMNNYFNFRNQGGVK